jgi:hypothetical protein
MLTAAAISIEPAISHFPLSVPIRAQPFRIVTDEKSPPGDVMRGQLVPSAASLSFALGTNSLLGNSSVSWV